MRVITRRRLNEFAETRHEAKAAPAHRHGLAKQNNFSNFAGLKKIFPSADHVGKLIVFNVGGNKFA
jgi:mRNA interferase HigB